MASSAQRAARPHVPRPPDGTYAVPDPADPAVLTLWRVRGGELSAWPPGHRWAPFPPRAAQGLPPEDRRAQRERWYAATYWPWKVAVAAAIVDDPSAAAARFEDAVPEDARPVPCPTYEDLCAAERAEQCRKMRAAAVLQKAGLPYRHIAQVFTVSASTAWRWSREGLRIWEREHRPDELAAALAALAPLDTLREATQPPRRPRKPQPVPEDDSAVFAAWAAARFHLDPEQTAQLIAAAEDDPDWATLMDVTPDELDDLDRSLTT